MPPPRPPRPRPGRVARLAPGHWPWLGPCPVTLVFVLGAAAAYALNGPAPGAAHLQSYPALLRATLLHGNLEHLIGNLTLLALGGAVVEPRIGATRFAALALLTLTAATALEVTFAGPGFAGLSALSYGAMAGALTLWTPPRLRPAVALGIFGLVAAEYLLLSDRLAVFAHATGVAIMTGYTMFAGLFAPKGPRLVPMKWAHVAPVLAIIRETDRDDAEEADATFARHAFDTMFVLADGPNVMGVTGYTIDDEVPDLAWLSWTYLGSAYLGQGHGGQMLNDLLGKLNRLGIRKIFIETSDYEDFGKKTYAKAHKLYEEFGARVELTIPDYHAPGEAKLIYGLANPEAKPGPAPEPAGGGGGLALTGLELAPETDKVAGLRWEETPTGLSGTDFALNRAREERYRMAVLAIPADISATQTHDLTAHGFRRLGALSDYYGPGLGQEWWVHDLAP